MQHSKCFPIAAAVVCLLVASTASAGEFRPAERNPIPNTFVVTLEDHAARKAGQNAPELPTVVEVAGELERIYGGRITQVWEHALRGFVIEMPEHAARALSRHPAVKAVEQDGVLFEIGSTPYCYDTVIDPTQNPPFPSSPQTISCSDPSPQGGVSCTANWGLDRIDQVSLYRDSRYYFEVTGLGVHVYLVDTGIRATHAEFKNAAGGSRIGNGHNSAGEIGTNDCLGHGTHTAGILAGKTYGVAKNATIHPVKATSGCTGGATVTAMAGAINWITQNRVSPTVVSMSMNGPSTLTALNDAVKGLISNGATFVQSSGNNNDNACNYTVKNAAPSAIIAGGSDENDGRWRADLGDAQYNSNCESGPNRECGSNFGTCVDLFAPAAHIVSASHTSDTAYCRLTGTSMAAPHVAGVAALYMQNAGGQHASRVEARLEDYAVAGALQTSGRYTIGTGSPNLLLNTDTADSWVHATACFTGSCTGTTCTLDSSCSTVDADTFVWRYSWDFGDGTNALTGSTSVTHTFPAADLYNVTLSLIIWSGEESQQTRCVNTTNVGVYGCIH